MCALKAYVPLCECSGHFERPLLGISLIGHEMALVSMLAGRVSGRYALRPSQISCIGLDGAPRQAGPGCRCSFVDAYLSVGKCLLWCDRLARSAPCPSWNRKWKWTRFRRHGSTDRHAAYALLQRRKYSTDRRLFEFQRCCPGGGEPSMLDVCIGKKPGVGKLTSVHGGRPVLSSSE